jgi:glycosyltransferase involved in cell wall biosynthesis
MESILTEEVEDRLREIKRADIIVGIPSYNNAKTIGHVVKAVKAGLVKYFPERKSLIVNSDGGSHDGTPEIVKDTDIKDFEKILIRHHTSPVYKIVTPYHGIPGKGSAFRTIFHISRMLDAKVCVVVDADLRSITPEWIDLLARPIIEEDFDYVAPYYKRHKYDGTITNSIVYPLTRALYGKRIRQPIGGDFGFSGRLINLYISKDVWKTDVARYGIDIWATTTALANGFKVCQSFLGAKIHDPKDPATSLSAMLAQVVGAVFVLMDEYYYIWKDIKGSTSIIPTFGFQYEVGLDPIKVNLDTMIKNFFHGIEHLSSIWGKVLSVDVLKELNSLEKSLSSFYISDELWVKVIYDFAVAYHNRIINRDHLIKSLTPLYIGRTASFVIETKESSAEEVENRIERLCLKFEALKPYLIDRWEGG